MYQSNKCYKTKCMVPVRDIYIYPLNCNFHKLKKCRLATNIDFNICNIHSNLDRWIIIVEQNVRLQGSMHPVKFLSRGRAGDYGGRLASC